MPARKLVLVINIENGYYYCHDVAAVYTPEILQREIGNVEKVFLSLLRRKAIHPLFAWCVAMLALCGRKLVY